MKIFFILIIVMVVGSMFVGEVQADILTPEERAWIEAHPEIRLAPDPDFPPIEYFDNQGRYQGIAADYVALLEDRLDIKITIVKLPTWDDVLRQAKSRKIDMFGAASATPQRREYMNFTEPHFELPGVILVRDQVEGSYSLKDLEGLKVAVVSGYVWQDYIERDYPNFKLELAPNLLTGLRQLSFGNVDAMVANLAIATHYIEKAGITNLRVAGETDYYGRYSFGIRNDWPELNGILEKGLASISNQEREEIIKKWVRLKQESLFTSRLFWIYLTVTASFLLLFATLFWIWTLRRSVAKSTLALRTEFEQRKIAENAVRESEARYRTLFDSANDAIFLLENNAYVNCNLAATRLFGCSHDEFVQKPPYHFSPEKQPDGRDSIEKSEVLVKECLKGNAQVFEWLHCRDDGTLFDAEVSLNVYSADDHRYILAVVRDVTERKRIDRMKDEFISTISHEIRTPLTSIKGSLELILGGALGTASESIANMLNIADRNTKLLLHLVNDLLDIQKLQSGQMRFEFSPTDLKEFLHQAVSLNRPFAEAHKVAVKLNEILLGITVSVDWDRLMQVMNNLISNAAKFSEEGSVIEINVRQTESRVRISVVDKGTGIPEDFHDQVFERFTQADATNTRKIGGTGLGLNICRSIIQNHGGDIGFETIEGKGSTFYIDLPCSKS